MSFQKKILKTFMDLVKKQSKQFLIVEERKKVIKIMSLKLFPHQQEALNNTAGFQNIGFFHYMG